MITKNSGDILEDCNGDVILLKDSSLLFSSRWSNDSSSIDTCAIDSVIEICSQSILCVELVNFCASIRFVSLEDGPGALWIRRWTILRRSNSMKSNDRWWSSSSSYLIDNYSQWYSPMDIDQSYDRWQRETKRSFHFFSLCSSLFVFITNSGSISSNRSTWSYSIDWMHRENAW